jgi:quinol monooxygenase YgiN
MELYIFVRFHAKPGAESAVEAALGEVVPPTRQESGCISLHTFRSTRDPQLFYLHSRWIDEAAFDHHAGLPHTVKFIETVQPLIDHELDITRAGLID